MITQVKLFVFGRWTLNSCYIIVIINKVFKHNNKNKNQH